MGDPRDTPAMRQYTGFKQAHPDCLLMFRMGDFYESFFDDAEALHRDLGLTLSERPKGVPMAGVPHHQLENYLRRLIALGHRVAVADQIQDPREAKGVVERAVTRVVTPGTLVDESLLDAGASSALAAVCHHDHASAAAAVVELSTGRFTILHAHPGALLDRLAGRGITELLAPATADGGVAPDARALAEALGAAVTPRPGWHFRRAEAIEALHAQFAVATLEGFGLSDDDPALPSAGAAIRYLRETQALDETGTLAHLTPPRLEAGEDLLIVDAVSLRSLEIERTIREGRLEGSLLGVFLTGSQTCCTAMGRRRLRERLVRPSREAGAIRAAQAAVAALVDQPEAAAALREALAPVQDIARIAGRLGLNRATPRDLVALARSLERTALVRGALAELPAFEPARAALADADRALAPLARRIADTCVEEAPAHLREGGLIRDGIDPELDEARALQRDAGAWLAEYQGRLIAQHDLPSLKVGFNKVFGYYIELPAAQARRAPDIFTRKQTLKNAERYLTPELKAFEEKVTTAEARALARERALFDALCAAAAAQVDALARCAETLAEVDAHAALAAKARARGWVRPEITAEPILAITAGRHPVLDEALDTRFVPNDTALGGEHPSLALITGPNMAGKSTYIRQVALITLLAHAGSFVPAEAATIGVCDRLFTRVGADDALHRGQSTFMVEMTETANILHHATPRSLVILDEIGRGTSTLDGLSLAWAIAEHLSAENLRPRTLFATHYHELTDLEDQRPGRVGNLHVAVREWPAGAPDAEIVFLHRILPGRTDQSYGIHVAKLAGVPATVIARARQVLASLSVHHGPGAPTAPAPQPPAPSAQLGLFTEYLPHPVVDDLRALALEVMTPMDAFDALRALQHRLTNADAPTRPAADATAPRTRGR